MNLRGRRLLTVGAAAVLLSASLYGSASADPPSQEVGSVTGSVPIAVAGPGEVCVDVISKETDAKSVSLVLGSACSRSLSDARAQAAGMANATVSARSSSQASGTVTTLTSTLLIQLFIDYGQNPLQREIYGGYGPCDTAGYTYAAYSADVGRISSSAGYNNCNAIRLKDTGGSHGYFFQSVNFPGSFNDGTVEYHPYHV